MALALKTVRRATAMEPFPRTLRILKNMACFGSKARVIGKAVGEGPSSIMYPHRGAKKKGSVSNAKPSRLFFSSCYTGRPHGRGIEVPSVNLQDLLSDLGGEWAPTVLKVDCEGAGREFLNVSHFGRLRLIGWKQISRSGPTRATRRFVRISDAMVGRFPAVSRGGCFRNALSKRKPRVATSSIQCADVASVELLGVSGWSQELSSDTRSCNRQRPSMSPDEADRL